MPCLVFTALGLKLDLWGARGPHVDHSVLDRSRRGIKSAGCKSGVSHFQPLTKKGIMMIMHHVFLLYYLYIYIYIGTLYQPSVALMLTTQGFRCVPLKSPEFLLHEQCVMFIKATLQQYSHDSLCHRSVRSVRWGAEAAAQVELNRTAGSSFGTSVGRTLTHPTWFRIHL